MSTHSNDLVTQYLTERQAVRGTSDRSLISRRKELEAAIFFIENALDDTTTADALNAIAAIRARGWSKNYTHRVISSFKAFLLWMIEGGYGNLDEKKIRAIKSPGMDWRARKPEDILSREEFQQVMGACRSSRDRAIIALLYDGSFRPGEIIGLTWGDLIRDDYGIRLEFRTPKTGFERPIRLTYAVPYLDAWRTDYPEEITKDAPVFLQMLKRSRYEPLSYAGLRGVVDRLRERTGIDKLTPAIFRRSKITHDVEDGLDSAYLQIKNWGSLKTQMLAVYAKPSHEYVDKVALDSAGIKKAPRAVKGASLAPAICPECGTLNPSGAEYCLKCGESLTESAQRWEREIDRLAHDPERLRRLADKIEKRREERI